MWIEKFNKPYKEKIKKLTFNFADIKKGETMLVSSPSSIAKFIKKIPKGKKKTVVEMRNALAKKAKANKTCPVSTGIFLRIAIEASLEEQRKKKLKKPNLPFGELLMKKLQLQKNYLYLKSS